MTDVRILVSPDQLQQYIVSVSGSPGTVSWTDNTTFLHIRSFSSAAANGSAGLEARHVTLLAQGAATEASRSPSGLGSNSSTAVATAAVDSSSRSGTNADAAGILTVTDSYILSANNATLVTLLQQLAGLQQSNRPLLIFITSNMTFAHGDPRWPAGGVNITRPTIWIGSSSSNTSLDFHMDVGQFVLDGPTANVTLVNLALENLAYGDEVSARDAEGKSLIRSHLIWAFRYRRYVACVVHPALDQRNRSGSLDRFIPSPICQSLGRCLMCHARLSWYVASYSRLRQLSEYWPLHGITQPSGACCLPCPISAQRAPLCMMDFSGLGTAFLLIRMDTTIAVSLLLAK